ncbi:MAG: carbohydrate ABC transporter permease [Candidatus Hydrogenedentota bacterium]|jgi:ABC-type glycerol-3-phosphate transport system permease component|nr:MAG: carbohydrate ABC transporter permease [Candidatus Hydrogenedentota bacterium]
MAIFALTCFAIVVVVPFIYMVFISLKGPAEVGNGRFVPDAVRDLLRLRHRDFAFVEVRLSDEQFALLNNAPWAPEAPFLAMDPHSLKEMLVPMVPHDALWGRRIGLEKPGYGLTYVIALYEVHDPRNELRQRKVASILCPHPSGNAWEAVEAKVIPRNLTTMVGRLFANYRVLVSWEPLRSGHLLAWLSSGYPRWYLNSLFVALSTVILGVFFDSLAAFAFAKFEFPFRRILFGVLVATIMIPYPVTLVPTFFLFSELGLYNTYAALIVPGLVSAFGIFLVRQYVLTVPDDMLAAARVDGASDFELYLYVILPIARPILAALAVFRFIWQWNSYLYPLILTNRDEMKTVQLGLATLQGPFGNVDYGVQMAGATLAVVPILILYLFMQRHFIAGITMGSVKA